MPNGRLQYCPQCGAKAPDQGQYCIECGTQLVAETDGTTAPEVESARAGRRAPEADVTPTSSHSTGSVVGDGWYNATIVLFGVWVLGLGYGLTQGVSIFNGLALLALVTSIVTMVIDAHRVGDVADTPVWLWVVAAVLLYVVTVPYYLWTRPQPAVR